MNSLFAIVETCLNESDLETKFKLVNNIDELWQAGDLSLDNITEPHLIAIPGRPMKPLLVETRDLPKRRIGSDEGLVVLYHALAHIEFNAINLAADAIYRFRDMPRRYYTDMIKVMVEETRHFLLIEKHLASLGKKYGDYPAHNGLWKMAIKTADDILSRLAMVPRTLEARGLDVTPGIRDRLKSAGDEKGADILNIILHDEIGHVAIGNHWYHFICQQRELDPVKTYHSLLEKYFPGKLRGPFHIQARKQAGFTDEELLLLEQISI